MNRNLYNSPYNGAGAQQQQQQHGYPNDPFQPTNDPFNSNPYASSTTLNNQQDWDSRSAKSYNSHHSNGQQHHPGGPQYEMSQVSLPRHAPPPPLPYQQNPPSHYPDYPPPNPANVQFSVPPRGTFAYPERPGGGRDNTGYNNVREKMMKRRSVRKVPLQQGNLVLDVAVPTHLVNGATSEEMTKMRYTAATCDPDDFMRSKFSLRPYLYKRQTEIFIVMTMYNEDEVLFVRTMNAVIKNVAHFCSSNIWGAEGWKRIVVCVVSDGRNKINQRTLQVLSLMGCYQEGIPKDTVGGKDVTAHIFEFTSQVTVTDTGEVSPGPCPVQIIFCLKEQNKKKLNSHRWFFNAFGPLIQPNVCILLDVGTKPTGTSIYELWKCFDKHPNVGGACGEICVDAGRGCSLLLTSPLAASQNFEYKMSNILDKPLESVFGYISVLPGAFSAYRYKALLNGPNGKGPLASYFKGEKLHGASANGAGLFERNMYLAEDRILCFEIVTKKREAWTLKYVKSAKAATDVPTSLPEFISQRRRWLNGSFFAALHATVFFIRIWTSGHGFLRKLALQFEFIYNAIQMLFSWTSLANFYLAFFFLVRSATSSDNDAFNFLARGAGVIVFDVILKLYIALIFVVLICSLGNRPQGSKITYTIAVILFGFCNIITLWCAGWTVYLAVPHTAAEWSDFGSLMENPTFRDIAISLLATYGLYFIASFMHFEPWHMFTSFLREYHNAFSYMFFLPSYVNILMLYSMCNLHDIGWGTKGDNGSEKDLGAAKASKDKDGKDVMEVDLPTSGEDVDALWTASRNALRNKPAEVKESRDAATKQTDQDRNTRTNVVLLWVGTNMGMVLVFTSTAFTDWVMTISGGKGNGTFNPYLVFLFYSLAGLSLVRFFGTTAYLVMRLCGH